MIISSVISLLIWLLVIVAIIELVLWILGIAGLVLPPRLRQIVYAILGLVFLLYALQLLLGSGYAVHRLP